MSKTLLDATRDRDGRPRTDDHHNRDDDPLLAALNQHHRIIFDEDKCASQYGPGANSTSDARTDQSASPSDITSSQPSSSSTSASHGDDGGETDLRGRTVDQNRAVMRELGPNRT